MLEARGWGGCGGGDVQWSDFGKHWVRTCGKHWRVPGPCASEWRGSGWGGSHGCPHRSLTSCSLPLPAEIRTQLVEQFKCLEQQSESRLQLLQDLQEFFRRKAEIELEYSRSLEKLAERFSSKIRSSREHQFK